MTYQIKYTYDTGDSFHTEENCVGFLELTWRDLAVAKQNLVRIREHYNYYRMAHGHGYDNAMMSKSDKKKALDKASEQDWFVKKYDFCLILKTDDGKDWQISAPWCGYFERLNEAEVVEDNSDRKISLILMKFHWLLCHWGLCEN